MTTVINNVWASDDGAMFEVANKNTTVEFEKFADGEFYIGIDGYQKESIGMSAEQFAIFKNWIMTHC